MPMTATPRVDSRATAADLSIGSDDMARWGAEPSSGAAGRKWPFSPLGSAVRGAGYYAPVAPGSNRGDTVGRRAHRGHTRGGGRKGRPPLANSNRISQPSPLLTPVDGYVRPGLIYLDDSETALQAMRRALYPHGLLLETFS